MPEEKPKYRHDNCLKCHFLGTYKGEDLYVHWDSKGEKTVIVRYGDRPGDYTSGLPLVGNLEPLKEALKRAILRGIVPKNVAYPLAVRRAFRDDLEKMEAFDEFIDQETRRYRGKPLTEQVCEDVERIIRNLWYRYYQMDMVTVDGDHMPGFRVLGEGSALLFKWDNPEYGVGGDLLTPSLETATLGGR